jgi:hypothetical protein
MVDEDTYRGGLVFENGAQTNVNEAIVVCEPTDCLPASYTTHTDWVTMGSPSCWCAPYHCDGDAGTSTEGFSKYRVYTTDLGLVIGNWKKKISDYPATLNPCADVDHKSEGFSKYRVYTQDLGKVIANWKKKDSDLPGNCPRPE